MARRTAGMLAAALCAATLAAGTAAANATARPRHAGPQRVLIVQLAATPPPARSIVSAARTAVATTLRHVFPTEHALSVAVPAGQAARARAELAAQPGVQSVTPTVRRTFDAVPNDPDYDDQQTYFDAVRASAAWSSNHGSPDVRVAVVDSGIDLTHPDLAGKVVGSYDASTGLADITDTVGHGTFVAGVAAAATDNGIGVAGAGYDTSLLGVKVADASGTIAIDDEVAGIRWAADHGADIINLSLGGPDPSKLERQAITYAQTKGALVVAAAGNGRTDHPQYPAAYPGVLSVAATDPTTGGRPAFSSHGPWVAVAAPGVDIYSTVPVAGSTDFPQRGLYGRDDGTSFAAPLVAGEAALIESKNDALPAARVRRIVVASAHGYRGLGLGAGQVDFARALGLTPPTTLPSAVAATGDHDTVTFTASTPAKRVSFAVDDGPPLPPVRASDGTATLPWPSYGYPNGSHLLHAYNCASGGACSTDGVTSEFSLHNPPPAIAAPAPGGRVTGRFAVRASAPPGGALRLFVDGRPAGIATQAPWRFLINGSSLATGRHMLRLRSCAAAGSPCGGPLSAPVGIRVAALHPQIVGVAPRRLSPNGDAVHDAALLRFRLPVRQWVQVQLLDAAGTVVQRSYLGIERAGRHTWSWRPGSLPDGTYTIALSTRRAGGGQVWRGWGSRTAVIDTRAPHLTRPTGGGSVAYPVRDGFRDSFRTTATPDEAARITLVVRDTRGAVVHRSVRTASADQPVTLGWNGRARGRLLPAGTYRWRLQATDAAGNTRTSRLLTLRLSHKRLVTLTRVVSRAGAAAVDSGATDPQCTSAAGTASAFPAGLLLTNGCPEQSFDLAYARYAFRLPAARQYLRLALVAEGRARTTPSQLSATVERTDTKLEQPSYVTVRGTAEQAVRLATVPARGHVTRQTRVFANLLLDSRYPGRNAYDVDAVRLRVTFRALRR